MSAELSVQPTMRSAPPLRVRLLALSDLMAAAVRRVLLPYPDQVVFAATPCDVGMIDPDLLPEGWRRPSGLPLVAVTRDGSLRSAELAEKLGASAVVGLDLSAERLLDTLQIAARDTTGALADAVGDLSRRETEVLTMICAGSTNAEIASALFLSPNSVKTYIRTAYRKIGVTRRSQAVIWGVRRGL